MQSQPHHPVEEYSKHSRLGFEPDDIVLQSFPGVVSTPLELVLHCLQVSHQVGKVSPFATESVVLFDQSVLDVLRGRKKFE